MAATAAETGNEIYRRARKTKVRGRGRRSASVRVYLVWSL